MNDTRFDTQVAPNENNPPKRPPLDKKTFKKKFKKEGRRVRGISPMAGVSPYIMVERNDSQNLIRDTLRTDKIDRYIKEKQRQGMTNFSIMHYFMASYIRAVSQRPAINRFIRGQKVYTRDHIEICLTIKKEMTLESPDTVVKAFFTPDATAEDVYYELNRIIEEYRNDPGGSFDNAAKIVNYIPGVFKKFVIWLLKLLDYFGGLPRFLTKLSPFHGSFFITSMGSLGIPPIYHHLYNFGNVPMFIAFGTKRHACELDLDGNPVRRKYVDYTVVTDERICDGFAYASAFKVFRRYLANPYLLDNPPEEVFEDPDIDKKKKKKAKADAQK